MGLRVGREEAILVLHVDHGLAPEVLGEQEAASVGAIGWDQALGGRRHPKLVGRHAAENDGAHLGEIERYRRKRSVADVRNSVLRQKLGQHRRILAGHRCAHFGEQARRQT